MELFGAMKRNLGSFLIVIVVFAALYAFYSLLTSDVSLSVLSGGYTYPDQGDAGIFEVLLTLESRMNGSNHDPEVIIWSNIEKHLTTLKNNQKSVPSQFAMLDAGCGSGRLMEKYCNFFDKCIGVDADERRVMAAIATLKSSGIKSAQFEVVSADAFVPREKFDFIVNSMVIQHVPNYVAEAIVQNLVKALKPGGILIITTTHYPVPFYEAICVSSSRTPEYVQTCDKAISRDEFDHLAATEYSKMLPVHHWTEKELLELVSAAGCSHVHGTFQGTYFKRGSKGNFDSQQAFIERFGVDEQRFYDNPISQGVVCSLQ